MGKNRHDGEGTIYRRGKKWVATISCGIVDGKRVRRSRIRNRRSDAVAALNEMRDELLIPGSSPTVGEYLKVWLRDTVSKLADNTRVSYTRQVNNWIVPKLGNVRLAKLNAMQIEAFCESIPKACTRRYAFRVLRTALNRAVRLRLIPANPCSFADKPKHSPAKADPFTQAEAKAILAETEGSVFAAVYEMGLGLGMRYGEIMGLHWNDVNFDDGTIYVHQQLITANGEKPHFAATKTESSVRTLNAPQRLLDALHDRRAMMLRDGLAKDQRVICGRRGGTMWPQTFWTKRWQPLLEKLGIRHRGFHHTRHTYATLQLRSGVPPHIVASVLGHTSAVQTLKTYAHVLEGDGQSAADSIGRLLG